MTDIAQQVFCTISTVSHAHKTRALINSIRTFMPQVSFAVLWVDGPGDIADADNLTLADLSGGNIAHKIIKKYAQKPDNLRWSLKPVLIGHLLNRGFTQVIYLDNDLYFYNDPSFLMDDLKQQAVLLCPHWRINDPVVSKAWFHVNYTDGVYNAGFVGASQAGKEAIQWWANCCLYACEKNLKKGLFDDQKYLDLMPAEFDGVAVVKHRGCNLAYWNINRHDLSGSNMEVLVNGKYPVVFIHFTAKLEKEIKDGKLPLLHEYLSTYQEALKH